MSRGLPPIPSDFDGLKAFAAKLQAENLSLKGELEARDDEIYAKTLHIEKLKSQLAQLKRAHFGRSSEKLDAQTEQMELLIGEMEESRAAAMARRDAKNAVAPVRREKTHPVRQALPEHLPRELIEHEAACICPKCGSERMTKIGTDEREVLEYVPSHFKVIVHSRPKMACRNCEAVTQERMPSLPTERGIPGPVLSRVSGKSSLAGDCVTRSRVGRPSRTIRLTGASTSVTTRRNAPCGPSP